MHLDGYHTIVYFRPVKNRIKNSPLKRKVVYLKKLGKVKRINNNAIIKQVQKNTGDEIHELIVVKDKSKSLFTKIKDLILI